MRGQVPVPDASALLSAAAHVLVSENEIAINAVNPQNDEKYDVSGLEFDGKTIQATFSLGGKEFISFIYAVDETTLRDEIVAPGYPPVITWTKQ